MVILLLPQYALTDYLVREEETSLRPKKKNKTNKQTNKHCRQDMMISNEERTTTHKSLYSTPKAGVLFFADTFERVFPSSALLIDLKAK